MKKKNANPGYAAVRAALLRLLENAASEKESVEKLRSVRKTLLKIRDKGGVVVVAENGVAITTYRFDSYQPHRG